ncbi:FHA domain-containing protein [Agreia pratensis]|uniref:Forkhead associated (FHA) domain, binds pSer, pThr, pTyr n=1 Tax=Agreia pratensis TaxID=150121 RepID=A0A1X7JLS4_9MICO|nr:FHA domain-containing protein [Agreia pratensis]SMG29003.1 Forkhead associated (FHA) domain, binds pSer, pThr, pTyr [Agreia pratensis]
MSRATHLDPSSSHSAPSRRSLRKPGPSRLGSPAISPSRDVSRARPEQIVYGVCIDIFIAMICIGGCVAAFIGAGKGAGSVALVALLFIAGVQFHFWASRGQTWGWMLAGIRQVTDHDGAPLGYAQLVPPPPTWLADIRQGRDPITPTLAVPALLPYAEFGNTTESWTPSFTVSEVPPAPRANVDHRTAQSRSDTADVDLTILRPARGDARRIVVVDGKSRHTMAPRVLVGRNPTAAPGHSIVAIADLSRMMSKNHLLLETTPEGDLFVTDLGSTNGTTLVRAPQETLLPLIAQTRTRLELSDVLRIGEHTLAFVAPETSTGRGGE